MMLRLNVLIWAAMLCLSTIGCAPSGDDLSDDQWLSLHTELQQERVEIGRQRDLLEADRREWDRRERREPVLAVAIASSTLLVCSVLPLLLVALLLWPRTPEPGSDIACGYLIDDFVNRSAVGGVEPKRLTQNASQPKLPCDV